MAKFTVMPTVGAVLHTFRAGGTVASGNNLTEADIGKAVKIGGESAVVLATGDDEIFGFLRTIEPGLVDGYNLCGVQVDGYAKVDTDSKTIGSPVVVATNPAKGTAGLTKIKVAPSGNDDVGTASSWVIVGAGVIMKV